MGSGLFNFKILKFSEQQYFSIVDSTFEQKYPTVHLQELHNEKITFYSYKRKSFAFQGN